MCVCVHSAHDSPSMTSRSLKTANGKTAEGGGKACIKIAPATTTLTDGPPESDDERAAAREAFKLYCTEYFFIFFSPVFVFHAHLVFPGRSSVISATLPSCPVPTHDRPLTHHHRIHVCWHCRFLYIILFI